MIYSNMIVYSYALQSVAKSYVIIVKDISTFFEPIPRTNIITNETILKQYSIRQGIKVFGKKARLKYENSCISYIITELLIQRRLKT